MICPKTRLVGAEKAPGLAWGPLHPETPRRPRAETSAQSPHSAFVQGLLHRLDRTALHRKRPGKTGGSTDGKTRPQEQRGTGGEGELAVGSMDRFEQGRSRRAMPRGLQALQGPWFQSNQRRLRRKKQRRDQAGIAVRGGETVSRKVFRHRSMFEAAAQLPQHVPPHAPDPHPAPARATAPTGRPSATQRGQPQKRRGPGSGNRAARAWCSAQRAARWIFTPISASSSRSSVGVDRVVRTASRGMPPRYRAPQKNGGGPTQVSPIGGRPQPAARPVEGEPEEHLRPPGEAFGERGRRPPSPARRCPAGSRRC